MTKSIDPITLEVIRNGFIAAADEMRINLMRTAHNPIIYEVLDFSVGLFDVHGDMVAQAAGLPIFLGNLGDTVRTVCADIGTDNLVAGDVYLINDPYTTGNHVNDVTAVSPVFLDQDLVGFTAARAHWLDLGGKDPGGSGDAVDVFQEGLRLRSIRLYRAGEPDRAIWRILRDNIRFADSHMGDLRAQVAACRTGERRFADIVRRFGLDTTGAAIREILRTGEVAARQAVLAMKDGVYAAEACLDDDGVGTPRPKIRVTVTIEGDSMTVDLSGSSPQCQGAINCGLSASIAGCRIAFKCVTLPSYATNEGCFRPLTVKVADDSMFNVQPPGPTFLYVIALITLCDVIFRALAPAMPDRIPAAHYGDMGGFMIYGTDPDTGEQFIHQEPEGGGWGAFADRDGENVLIFIADGDTRNVPVEVIENRFPLRLERYQLREDSGGPGRFRGGLGHYRDYRLLIPDARITAIMERSACPPWGLDGGEAGDHDVVVVNPDTERERVVMKTTGLPVGLNEIVSVRTGGGGGFGPPWERDPAAVLSDVNNGYVTLAAAAERYGVVIVNGSVDLEQTDVRRRELASREQRGST